MSPRFLTLAFMLLLFLSLLSSSSSMNSFHSKQIPAMYIFGDSFVDCGNNNHLPGGKASFLPYGIDFMGGKPTGRFTNGKTVVDFLAIHLGLPFVPAYLRLSNRQRNKISKGINYASGGSGILPETNNDTSLTLDKQIKYFKRTIKRNLPNVFHEKEELERHISESLYFVSTGVNDNFHNGTFRGRKVFALYLLNQISLRIQRLYSLGARKFFVNNLPPAGCFPSKAIHNTPRGTCDKKINKAISFYNRRFPALLQELQSKLPGFTYIHADLFEFIIMMRDNGKRYGILDTWKPCCPNTIYGDLKCRPNAIPCPNRDTRLFFDEHPSQVVNQMYATFCYSESLICKSSGLKLV